MNDDTFRERIHYQVKQRIKEENLWSIIHVFPTEEDPGPTFSYSVGMPILLNHPDVVVYGLSGDVAACVINAVGTYIHEGNTLSDGLMLSKAATDTNVAFWVKRVKSEIAQATVSAQLAPENKYAEHVFMLIWPDPNGNFPADPGWNVAYDEVQPRLWEQR